GPRRPPPPHVVGQRLVPGQRVAAPSGPGGTGADVVAGREAASLGAHHHDAGGRIAVGLVEAREQQRLELGRDRVELVGPVERDETDPAVDGVGHELSDHGGSSWPRTSLPAATEPYAIRTPAPRHAALGAKARAESPALAPRSDALLSVLMGRTILAAGGFLALVLVVTAAGAQSRAAGARRPAVVR